MRKEWQTMAEGGEKHTGSHLQRYPEGA